MGRTKINEYSKTKLYNVWNQMKLRCNNKNHQAYKDYGGRGIRVCNEWYDSITFCEWAINNGYEEGLTIDRIDNNGDYCPNNCQWITQKDNNSIGKRRPTRNTSGFTGVEFDNKKNLYRVRIYKDNKTIELGYYKLLEDAIKSRIDGEIKYFGERKTYM